MGVITEIINERGLSRLINVPKHHSVLNLPNLNISSKKLLIIFIRLCSFKSYLSKTFFTIFIHLVNLY